MDMLRKMSGQILSRIVSQGIGKRKNEILWLFLVNEHSHKSECLITKCHSWSRPQLWPCLIRNKTQLKVKLQLLISVFHSVPLGVTLEYLENPCSAVPTWGCIWQDWKERCDSRASRGRLVARTWPWPWWIYWGAGPGFTNSETSFCQARSQNCWLPLTSKKLKHKSSYWFIYWKV